MPRKRTLGIQVWGLLFLLTAFALAAIMLGVVILLGLVSRNYDPLSAYGLAVDWGPLIVSLSVTRFLLFRLGIKPIDKSGDTED